MKIYKGWVSNLPAYWVVRESEVKCICSLVKDEYVIANTDVKAKLLEEQYTETS